MFLYWQNSFYKSCLQRLNGATCNMFRWLCFICDRNLHDTESYSVKIFKCRKTFVMVRDICGHITSVSNVNTFYYNEIQQRTLTQTVIIQSYNYIPYFSEKLWENILIYTGCHRRNRPNFGRVFLMLNYTDITQNTYIQSWTVTEIMAREKCGHLAFPPTVHLLLCSALTVRLWQHKLRPTR